MQGMKIKSVVPGKNQVSLWKRLGQSIANMSLDISLLRHSKLRILSFFLCSWLLLLLVVCVNSLSKEEGGEGFSYAMHFHV